jgi:hypothetical protein
MSEPAATEGSAIEMSEAAAVYGSSTMEMSKPAAKSAMEAPEVMEAMAPPK